MSATDPLDQAEEMGYRRVPGLAITLLQTLSPPPRLVAHLVIVHEVAIRLMDGIAAGIGSGPWDAHAIRFGAATHDLGKCRHRGEITSPGHAHEDAGEQLLQELGADARLARFSRTHEFTHVEPATLELEDLMVALADVTWKGKRSQELEELLAQRLSDVTERSFWDVLQAIDDAVQGVAGDSGNLLAWQNSFPTQ